MNSGSLRKLTTISAIVFATLTGCTAVQPEKPVEPIYVYKTVNASAESSINQYFDDQFVIFSEIFEGFEVTRPNVREIKITIPNKKGFITGSSNLTREVRNQLDEMAAILEQYKESSIWVYGHTDTVGSFDRNLSLSDERALSVSRQLASNGIHYSRIKRVAESFEMPKCSNSTSKGKECNRRVELVIRSIAL